MITVGIGEGRGELRFQHMGLDCEVQAATFPQGRKVPGWRAALEELIGGRQARCLLIICTKRVAF